MTVKVINPDGISRKEMPQIPKASLGAFIEFLLGRGILVQREMVPVDDITILQKEVNQKKIDNLLQIPHHELIEPPFLLDQDSNVVDGNHRALAMDRKGMTQLPTYRISAAFDDILSHAEDFEGTLYKGANESFRKLVEGVNEMSFADAPPGCDCTKCPNCRAEHMVCAKCKQCIRCGPHVPADCPGCSGADEDVEELNPECVVCCGPLNYDGTCPECSYDW